MNFQIRTSQQKLKELRKKYHMTQSELAGNTMTRSLIAQLEKKTNPLKLTEEKAKLIIENIKISAKRKGIKLEENEVSVKYLTETLEEQQKRVLKSIKKEISLYMISKFDYEKFSCFVDEIEKFFQVNILQDVDCKINLYKDIANIYRQNYCYSYSELLLLKATACSMQYKKYSLALEMILERIALFYEIKNYKEALILSDYALDYYKSNSINNIVYLKKIYFNKAAILNKENKPYESCECLENLQSNQTKFSLKEKLDIMTIYANNYKLFGNYEKSIKIYLRILDKAIENGYTNTVTMTYRNLSEIYTKLGNHKEAKKYLESSISLRDINNYTSKIDIYLNLLDLNVQCNVDSYKIKKLFKDLILSCNKANNMEAKLKAYIIILDYYIKINDDNEVIKLLKEIRFAISIKNFKINLELFCSLMRILKHLKERNELLFEEAFTIINLVYNAHKN